MDPAHSFVTIPYAKPTHKGNTEQGHPCYCHVNKMQTWLASLSLVQREMLFARHCTAVNRPNTGASSSSQQQRPERLPTVER